MTTYVTKVAISSGLSLSILASAVQIHIPYLSEVVTTQKILNLGTISSTHTFVPFDVITAERAPQMTTSAPKIGDAIGEPQYPQYIGFASLFVIAATVTGAIIGYLFPGPLTGLILPVALSLWWLLYRIIVRYDRAMDRRS